MFLKQSRETVKEIQGTNIKFRYPSISDEILIESKKHLLTRGQYSSMSIGILNDQIQTMNLVDALSTLPVVASFVDEDKKDHYWEGYSDDDGKEFVLKVYEEFLNWRQSFRVKSTGNNEGQKELAEKSS